MVSRFSRGRMVLVGLSLLSVAVACEPSEPDPSIAPIAMPPLLRMGAWSFDGTSWTFAVVVDPRGLSTDVVLEWGDGVTVDSSLPVEAGLLEPQQVTITIDDLPADGGFCARFKATSEAGSTIVDARCNLDRQPRTIAPEPSPSG